jgi:hypothetical protein
MKMRQGTIRLLVVFAATLLSASLALAVTAAVAIFLGDYRFGGGLLAVAVAAFATVSLPAIIVFVLWVNRAIAPPRPGEGQQ